MTLTAGDDALAALARLAADRPAIVLDDDPTGTQTLRDVPVLTTWDAPTIARHLDQPVVFLSTNSRSLEADAARAITRDAISAAMRAARTRGRAVSLVSRSDSTLRGHFPVETMAMAEAAGMVEARFLLAPFFADGRRVTVGDVHYVEHEGRRVPVGQTEYARDRAFGYRASNLRAWIVEKYAADGRIPPPTVSLDLELVRAGGPGPVAERLLALPPGGVAIANAETDADIEVIARGAVEAELRGLPLIARVAASYVRARAGRSRVPVVEPRALAAHGPGVVVVGSHVETTSRQLDALRARCGDRLVLHELLVEPLLGADEKTLQEAARTAEHALQHGRTAVLYTQRRRHDVGLAGGRKVSASLAEIVGRVQIRPGWVLAKGGITSHDVARNGLAMREARVAGQLLPGVPVWIGERDSRWPGVPLVVFPGNVGDDEALADAVQLLAGET